MEPFIYIKSNFNNLSVCPLLFWRGGIFPTQMGGQIFLHTWGMKISTHKRGDKQFYTGSSGNKNVSGEKGEDVREYSCE